MKDYYDPKRSKGPILEEEGKVYLLRRNIRLKRPYEKLDFKKGWAIPTMRSGYPDYVNLIRAL